ncbi:MAG: substrate-binding domain-containing protein, partial [Firmicutes bacterium]|nr:substrate-binding domain-containing protein [Bacillota bacterium]
MKKFLALFLSLVMVLALAACGGGSSDTTTAPGSDAGNSTGSSLNVGVFYYTYADTYISSVRTALDAQLTAAGISYTNYDCNNTQATQNDYVRTAVTNGCNLLIVNLCTSGSADAAKAIMDIAGDIPVIFFNRAVEGDGEEGTVLGAYDNICFVGTDAPEAGHLQGQMVGQYVLDNYDAIDLNGDGVISYALFKGDEANVEAIYRTQYGVEDADALLTAAGKPALSYFDANNAAKYQVDQAGNWSAQAASDYMNTNLASYNESNGNMIELIICNNDNMAEGAIAALNTAGYNLGDGASTTIPVFGVDATEAAQELIAAGKMTGTVKQDAEGMAAAITATAKAIGEGKTVTDAIAA